MSDSDGIVGAFIGVFVGAALFFSGFKTRKIKKLIEGTATSKIRSIAMGPVEVYAEVTRGEKGFLQSPFSSKDCVYYKYTVEEYKKQGKSSSWVVINSFFSKDKFYVKDDTGEVLVDPNGAEMDIPADSVINRQGKEGFPAEVVAFLEKKNMNYKSKGIFGGTNYRQLRFTEYFLAPKDKVYIFGTAGKNTAIEQNNFVKNEEGVMIQKGTIGYYYISDSPEANVLKKFKWRIIGQIYGGAIILLVCLFFIFSQFGIL